MKKNFSFLWLLLFSTCVVQAQPDSTTVWISTALTGNIYAIDMNNCSSRFVCGTGKNLYDIAFTPDGKLWGNTIDSLYEIDTITGATNLVGHILTSNSLVGLNDSTLFIESGKDLYSLKTTDAATQMIGHIGYAGDGDLTWLGSNLYMYGQGYLIKLALDSSYSAILSVDTLRDNNNPYIYATYALATAYIDSIIGYSIIALPGDTNIYVLDSISSTYQLICVLDEADTAWGGACMVFPPSRSPPIVVREVNINNNQIAVYPNPATKYINVQLNDFNGTVSDVALLLYDYMGRLLIRRTLKSTKEKINIDGLNPGLYFVRLLYKDKEVIMDQKIIVKK